MVINTVDSIIIPDHCGIYSFYPDGATGKTYLARKLSDAYSLGYPCYTVRYENSAIIEVGNKNSARVMILDRFDMYGTLELLKEFEILSKMAVVLVETKHPDWYDSKLGFADIEFTKDKIEVIL